MVGGIVVVNIRLNEVHGIDWHSLTSRITYNWQRPRYIFGTVSLRQKSSVGVTMGSAKTGRTGLLNLTQIAWARPPIYQYGAEETLSYLFRIWLPRSVSLWPLKRHRWQLKIPRPNPNEADKRQLPDNPFPRNWSSASRVPRGSQPSCQGIRWLSIIHIGKWFNLAYGK